MDVLTSRIDEARNIAECVEHLWREIQNLPEGNNLRVNSLKMWAAGLRTDTGRHLIHLIDDEENENQAREAKEKWQQAMTEHLHRFNHICDKTCFEHRTVTPDTP